MRMKPPSTTYYSSIQVKTCLIMKFLTNKRKDKSFFGNIYIYIYIYITKSTFILFYIHFE